MPESPPPIFFYDSKEKQKKPFKAESLPIRMYVCGPTVYDRAHIGNARPVVVFDVLFRFLRKMFSDVIYVRNITDIDDKIIERAATENVSIRVLTGRVLGAFEADVASLGVLPPTAQPKATDHVSEMIQIIETLVKKRFAYFVDGHVMFHVKHFDGYGVLSGCVTGQQEAGVRIEVQKIKKAPQDFVLWKPSSDDEPSWDSPWGRGRPGWHIECSAMSHKFLGKSFDIHGGGQDLLFPHHENERAQTCACFDLEEMSRFWLHNGMLRVEGQKMSKSLGNILTINQVVDAHGGNVVRWCLLSAQYRKPLDWTARLTETATKSMEKIEEAFGVCDPCGETDTVDPQALEALASDLNTVLALQRLQSLASNILKNPEQKNLQAIFIATYRFLGFIPPKDVCARKEVEKDSQGIEKIDVLVEQRLHARRSGDYALADALRQKLCDMGVVLEDRPGKTLWKWR